MLPWLSVLELLEAGDLKNHINDLDAGSPTIGVNILYNLNSKQIIIKSF